MAEIIARFADGRLLVQEDRAVQTETVSGGYATLRVGLVRTIEKVLSIDAEISGYPDQKVAVPLRDVLISGDILRVQLRRMDWGLPYTTGGLILGSGILSSFRAIASGVQLFTSGGPLATTINIGSGTAGLNQLSGIVSGLGYYEPLTSGRPVSGVLRVLANVIAY